MSEAIQLIKALADFHFKVGNVIIAANLLEIARNAETRFRRRNNRRTT